MAKVFTAQELRDRADYERSVNGNPIAAKMLRQAADALEREDTREKKYEYSVRYFDRCEKKDAVDDLHHTTSAAAERYLPWFQEAKCIVRREVGEWEEVKDGE